MLEFTGERFIPTKELLIDEIGYEHLHRYYSILPFISDKKVLDIACGEGYGTALIAGKAKFVYGIDIDKECIDWATGKYVLDNLSFRQGTVAKIPIEDDTLDVIISFETIEHVNEEAQAQFMKEIKRVLKQDGLLIISTPNIKNYSERYEHTNEFHIKEFDKKEFSTFIKRFFRYTYEFEQGYEIVSTITGHNINDIKELNVYNWGDNQKKVDRKYIISIASDHEVKDAGKLASVVLQVDKDFPAIIDYIFSLQKKQQQLYNTIGDKDTEILNLTGFRSDIEKMMALLQGQQLLHQHFEEAREKDRIIESNKEILEKMTMELQEKKMLIEVMLEQAIQNEKLKSAEIRQLNESYSKIQVIVHNLEQESSIIKAHMQDALASSQDQAYIISELNKKLLLSNQQLEKANGRLSEIFSSEGWKLLSIYYKFKGKYLPEGSPRYNKIKKIFNTIRLRKEESWREEYFSNLPVQEKPVVMQTPVSYQMLNFPTFDYPRVSIIIPAYNGWEINYRCLRSILDNTSGISYEIIFVDDLSTDETANIHNYIKNIHVIRNKVNLGFLQNCNNAAALSKGTYIVLLNNDTEVRAGWLQPLTRLMDDHSEIGLTGSKLIYPDGSLQEAGGIIWKDASGWNFGHRQQPDSPMFNYVKEVDYISGAAIMVRADLWREIGGFDLQYSPAYFEDTDLAFEIRKRGYKVVFQPLSEVVHHEGYSNGTEKNGVIAEDSIKAYQLINKKKFYDKWKNVLEVENFDNAQHVFLARDRSRNKKTILFIDHYVPHFDKDAGSRHTYQYLKLMSEMGYNIKFIGDNYFRHEPYTTLLQQMGIEVLYGEYYKNNWKQWVTENKEYLDFAYLHRPHISVKYIDFIKANTNCRIIYFGHDLHYYREAKQYDVDKNPALLDSSRSWKKTEISLFDKSDIILTPSEKEKQIIQELSANFNVTTLPLFYFDQTNPPVSDFSKRKNLLFIGGFNHTPNLDAVLWFLTDIWPAIKERIPAIKFIIAGSNVPEAVSRFNSTEVIIKGYVSDEELQCLYGEVRLIVIPLRYGAGVKGKTLEAMHNGVPIVTTADGIEGMSGKIDFINIATDAADFAGQVCLLYNDEQQLVDLSKKNIAYIESEFSRNKAEANLQRVFGNAKL